MGAMYWLIGDGMLSLSALALVMWAAHRRITTRSAVRRQQSQCSEDRADSVVEGVTRQKQQSDEWFYGQQLALVSVKHQLAQGKIDQLGRARKGEA